MCLLLQKISIPRDGEKCPLCCLGSAHLPARDGTEEGQGNADPELPGTRRTCLPGLHPNFAFPDALKRNFSSAARRNSVSTIQEFLLPPKSLHGNTCTGPPALLQGAPGSGSGRDPAPQGGRDSSGEMRTSNCK